MSNTARIDTYFALPGMTFLCLEDAETINADRVGPCSVLIENLGDGTIVHEVLQPHPGQDYPHGHCIKSLTALANVVLENRQRRGTDLYHDGNTD